MVSAWRNFKNIFPRPLFIIIFRPEMLKFHPYSILTGDTRVEFVIYCVLNTKHQNCKLSDNHKALKTSKIIWVKLTIDFQNTIYAKFAQATPMTKSKKFVRLHLHLCQLCVKSQHLFNPKSSLMNMKVQVIINEIDTLLFFN